MAKTFLVVDDEVRIGEIIEDFIHDTFGEDSKVIKTLNGKEALAKFGSEHHIDLIFLDIIMPEVNGIKFIETLRTEMMSNTPILVVSASVEEAQEKTSKYQNISYLSKPIMKEDFDIKVMEILKP